MAQVLVAAGDAGTRESLRAALAEAGCAVWAVETGMAALTAMASSPHLRVVVLDVELPDLDGLQVLRFASAALHGGWRSGTVLLAPPGRPISLGTERRRGRWSPQILAKPVNRDALITAVRIAAARQRAATRRASGRARQAVSRHDSAGVAIHA